MKKSAMLLKMNKYFCLYAQYSYQTIEYFSVVTVLQQYVVWWIQSDKNEWNVHPLIIYYYDFADIFRK